MDDMEKDLKERFYALIASQGELVGSITHDLKGLISGLDGGLYLMESGVKNKKQERIDQGFDMVKRNADRIRRIVSNLLYYVKDRELDWHPVDLKDVVDSVVKVFSEYTDHLGMKMKVNIEEGSFEGNRLAVYSVLVNTIDYLLEASRPARKKKNVVLSLIAATQSDEVVFDLATNAYAINEESKEYSLRPFYSPKGVDRSHLALFMVRKIITHYHGTLEIIRSEETSSTRIVIKLPPRKPVNF